MGVNDAVAGGAVEALGVGKGGGAVEALGGSVVGGVWRVLELGGKFSELEVK